MKMRIDNLTNRPSAKKGDQFFIRVTAARINQKTVDKIGRNPIERLAANLSAHPDLRDFFKS
jgi:hypothetical protein